MNDVKPSLWERIREYFADMTAGNPIFDYLRGPAEESVNFTIAIIALSAKMAKADGRVTVDEVRTLRQIFEFNERDEADIARVFDLARQDATGFQSYARRIFRMFPNRPEMIDEIFESLFLIAMADGQFHENERIFLEEVREIFHVRESFFRCLTNRYAHDGEHDPYQILGVEYNASDDDIKKAYHQIIRDNHPDAMRARGLPEETIALAEKRVRVANSAYEALSH